MENWKDSLKDALGGFEVKPFGLPIDDVIAMAKADVTPFWKRRWAVVSMAALLSAAAAISVVVLTKDGASNTVAPEAVIAESPARLAIDDIPAPAQLTDAAAMRRHITERVAGTTTYEPVDADTIQTNDYESIRQELDVTTASADTISVKKEETSPDMEKTVGKSTDTMDDSISMDEWLLAQTTPKPKRKLRLGVEAGGLASGFSFTSATDYDLASSQLTDSDNPKIEGKDDEDSPTASSTETKGEDTPTVGQNTICDEAEHEVPLKFGISVSAPLTDRLSLVSGLMYSHQRSSIDRTVGGNASSQRYSLSQTLDYVGIPLGLEYEIWSPGRFSISAYGGMAVEKMVRGRRWETGYEDSSRKRVSMKPLQWSATASAVLEYDFTNFLGLYFQPGVSYYFDNGSSLVNYYGDNPVALDLRLGLRLSLFH